VEGGFASISFSSGSSAYRRFGMGESTGEDPRASSSVARKGKEKNGDLQEEIRMGGFRSTDQERLEMEAKGKKHVRHCVPKTRKIPAF